jgi:hypothetical protein
MIDKRLTMLDNAQIVKTTWELSHGKEGQISTVQLMFAQIKISPLSSTLIPWTESAHSAQQDKCQVTKMPMELELNVSPAVKLPLPAHAFNTETPEPDNALHAKTLLKVSVKLSTSTKMDVNWLETAKLDNTTTHVIDAKPAHLDRPGMDLNALLQQLLLQPIVLATVNSVHSQTLASNAQMDRPVTMLIGDVPSNHKHATKAVKSNWVNLNAMDAQLAQLDNS